MDIHEKIQALQDKKAKLLNEIENNYQKDIRLLLKELHETKREIKTEKKIENKEDTGWIQTHSGIKFFPFAPRIEDINISDIAWHLSGINRYLGALTSQWSVGQHSILGAWIIYRLTGDKLLALWFLLHDSPEAYLGDIIRPFKLMPQFSFYKPVEQHLYQLILHKFKLIDLSLTTDNFNFEPEIIKEMDRLMLYTEIEYLRHPIHPDNAYMPGSAEHLALKEKFGWCKEYENKFRELLGKDSKIVYQIFLYDFNLYSKQ